MDVKKTIINHSNLFFLLWVVVTALTCGLISDLLGGA
jgi:hypothetical protein